MPKYLIYNLIICKNISVAAFLFIVGTTLYSNSSQKRVPEEAAAHVNDRIFYTRCFDIAKKAPPERVDISISYIKRVRKPFRKKCKKTRSGDPSEQVGISISYRIRMRVNFKKAIDAPELA